jgi:hypothetical protein
LSIQEVSVLAIPWWFLAGLWIGVSEPLRRPVPGRLPEVQCSRA